MSNLYIQQLPSSFSSLGEKHNALVDVVKSMSGAGGINVKVSDANIIIDGTSVTGGGGSEGAAIEVVGSDGKLNKVPKHSTWATPVTYPTELRVVNGTKSITLDSNGFTMNDSSTGKSLTISFSLLTQSIALRSDAYCDGATTKSMLHLGSAPY